MEVIKTVTLNLLEPTKVRQEKLMRLRHTYKEALSFVVAQGVNARRTKPQSIF